MDWFRLGQGNDPVFVFEVFANGGCICCLGKLVLNNTREHVSTPLRVKKQQHDWLSKSIEI